MYIYTYIYIYVHIHLAQAGAYQIDAIGFWGRMDNHVPPRRKKRTQAQAHVRQRGRTTALQHQAVSRQIPV